MPDLAELSPLNAGSLPQEIREAQIIDDATELGQEVRCVIPSHDQLLASDPLPWSPVTTSAGVFYPKKGCRAQVAYPADGYPTVHWWQPLADAEADDTITADSGKEETIDAPAGIYPLKLTVKDEPFIDFENIATEGDLAPTIQYHGTSGGWGSGIDVAATTPCRDFVLAFKLDYPAQGSVNDFVYASHNGDENDPTIGIGKAQPGTDYRTWIVGPTVQADKTMGTLRLQAGNEQTGNILTLTNYGGSDRIWVDPSDSNTWPLRMRGDATVSSKPSIILQSTTDDSETLALMSNGTIRWSDDSSAALSRSAESTLKAGGNLVVHNFLGVGGGVAGTPTATLDVTQSGANAASFKLRAEKNGALEMRSEVSVAACYLRTTNASSLALGTNGTARINISSGGNIGFFGHAAAAQPTGVAETSAAIIEALKSIGIFG